MNVVDDARRLAADLRARGDTDDARRIDDAIDGAATGSELLVGLGSALYALTQRPLEPKLSAEVASLIERLSAALR